MTLFSSGLFTQRIFGDNSSGLSKVTIIFGGQSLAEYYFTRGVPRHAVYIAGQIKTALALGGSSTFTTYSGGDPIVVSNGSSKTDPIYTVRLVNSAAGGSALLDTSSGGIHISTGNYWWNTQDNSATSPDGALDATPNTPGPLWRALMDNIDTYGLNAFVWSQGQTDAGANMTTYEAVLRDLFDAVRTQSAKPLLPIFIMHIKDGNVASETNLEAIAKVQTAIALDTDKVYLVQEYASAFAIAERHTGCTYTSGSSTISTANTAGFGVNHRISGTGIPDPSYVTTVNSGVSLIIDQVTTEAQTNVTCYRWDNTHPAEGPDGVEIFVGDENRGFNEIGKRLVRALNRHFIAGTTKKAFGPNASSLSITAGSYTVDIGITHDEGTDLTKYDGSAIDLTASNIMRFESKGVVLTPTDFDRINATTLRATFASPIPSGSFKYWPAYGAMNRKTLGNMIMDNAATKLPLFRKSPDLYPEISVTVAPVSRGPLQAIGLSNIIAQWDATLSSSYSGSGSSWLNIATTPADGTAQSGYDMTLSGLTFNGSANDAAAYFSTAGAGYAELATANTNFLRDMHKTTGASDYSIAIAYYVTSTTQGNLFSTQNTATVQGIGIESSTQITHRQRGDTASASVSGGTISTGTWYLLIVTHDADGNASRRWLNTTTGSNQTHTFNTTTTDATVNMHIFSRTDAAAFMPSGARLKGALLMNSYIDDGMANFLFDYYNTLHNNTYA